MTAMGCVHNGTYLYLFVRHRAKLCVYTVSTTPSLKDQLLFEVESVAGRNPERVVILVLSLKEGKEAEEEEEQKGKANKKMVGYSTGG